MIEGFVFLTGFLVLLIFAAGGASRDNSSVTPPLGSTETCELSCKSLQAARQQICDKKADRTRFTVQRDSDALVLRSAQVTAALLLAAAVLAGLAPLVGPLIAAPLWTAYLVAQAYVVFVLGQVAQSAAGISHAESALAVAIEIDRQALNEVRRVCPEAEANRCINALPTC